jgi:4-diphosphocytidyl-2-C-methyl-D-erythritol kinase
VTTVHAYAKLNLALVVGERRGDGLHEVANILQRVELADVLDVAKASALTVEGFADTLVRDALTRLADAAGVEPRWRVAIDKRIPVAAGLGGGSADAGTALVAANRSLANPLAPERLAAVAASVGADVPFFLAPGPKLAEGVGERLTPLELPQNYWVVIALPRTARKASTADVYRRFDELGAGSGFAERRERLLAALARCSGSRDLAALPPNDLAEAAGRPALVDTLAAAGAFRADVTGAGPAAYGLFEKHVDAERAAQGVAPEAEAWVARPVW